MEKVLERDQKLSQLDDRADALQVGKLVVEISSTTTTLINEDKHRALSGRCVPVREIRGNAQEKVLVEEHQDDDHHVRDHCDPDNHHRSVGSWEVRAAADCVMLPPSTALLPCLAELSSLSRIP